MEDRVWKLRSEGEGGEASISHQNVYSTVSESVSEDTDTVSSIEDFQVGMVLA